jgi:hypothetical protein
VTGDRSILHLNQLEAFGQFLEGRGYVLVPPKGAYEVLRAVPVAKKPGDKPVIVYKRADAAEHATVQGSAMELVVAFIRSKRNVQR